MNRQSDSPKGLLPRAELRRRLFSRSPEGRLVVVPLLDPTQVGDGTVDLRLGTEFILSKRIRFAGLDVMEEGDTMGERLRLFKERLMDYQERVQLQVGGSITLHPQQFALGSSLEYVRLSKDLAGYVLGRSSWGRMGLVIATATMIHPSFAGSITLELANIGDAPITLYPGIRIAQIALHYAGPPSEEVSKPSKYSGLTGPDVTRIYEDEDWELIEGLRSKENL